MYDCARSRDILFQCEYAQTFEDRQINGVNGCGSMISYAYFCSFILMVSLIFLNLFIAIILEGQLQASQQQGARVTEQTRQAFTSSWMKYDPDATGFIKVTDLSEMILDLAHQEHQFMSEMLIKKKQTMFNLTTYPEVNLLMKINKGLPMSEVE